MYQTASLLLCARNLRPTSSSDLTPTSKIFDRFIKEDDVGGKYIFFQKISYFQNIARSNVKFTRSTSLFDVVGIATRYGLGGSGFEFRWGGGSFPVVKRPRRGADHC